MQRAASLHDALGQRMAGAEAYRHLLAGIVGADLDSCLVSTAEHLAPFNHATTVSFLWEQLLAAATEQVEPKSLVVLGGSLIPLDNADYPRGFLLPGNAFPPTRVNLWSQRHRKAVPLLLPVIDMPVEAQAFLAAHPYLTPTLVASNHADYASQLAAVMEAIGSRWRLNGMSPTLLVRPLEAVAADLLATLLNRRDALLMRLFEDADARAWLWQKLHGVFCAWDDGHGTFLLWSAAADGALLPLREQNGRLVGRGVSIPFDPEVIAAGLASRQLLPNVPLSLLAVSWLPGIPIAGGPKQVLYWRHMIEAFNHVLRPEQARPATLSQYGYGQIRLDNALAALGIPRFGTGLALAKQEINAKTAQALIASCQEIPPMDIGHGG